MLTFIDGDIKMPDVGVHVKHGADIYKEDFVPEMVIA